MRARVSARIPAGAAVRRKSSKYWWYRSVYSGLAKIQSAMGRSPSPETDRGESMGSFTAPEESPPWKVPKARL